MELVDTDGSTIVDVYSRASTQSGLDTASNSAVLNCNANQRVRLTAPAAGKFVTFCITNYYNNEQLHCINVWK